MAGMLSQFRLPMCRMGDANRETLRGILRQYALVEVIRRTVLHDG